MVTQHSVELDTLNSKTTYYFKVRSVDQSGNEALSVEKYFDVGKQPVLTGVEIAMSSMSIEEKPLHHLAEAAWHPEYQRYRGGNKHHRCRHNWF